MQTFEELLKVSLHGASEGFRKANGDLHRIVTEVSEAVLKLSSGKHGLLLNTARENDGEIFYELALSGRPRPIFLNIGFLVRAKGYPIQAGKSDPESLATPLGDWISLRDEAAIRKFFVDLTANQDSVLVQRLAFSMRRASKAAMDDDVPF